MNFYSSKENSSAPPPGEPINPEQFPQTDAPFPIVGIAASAGGLEAFIEPI
ncbi:MAG: hypothetical protein KME50_33870 [Nostoc desertorum CM1-VF14]|jgi:two-component system CheB/CheR fusion protein|nr:hypothetical protein [Nostoc desertorum CM1-VF14]